jgi:hypothetical protein
MHVYYITYGAVVSASTGLCVLCILCPDLIICGYPASTKTPKYMQPPARLPRSGWLLGLDTFWDSPKTFHQHRLLSWSTKHFEHLVVKTLRLKISVVGLIVTIEPGNLQTILALKSGSWGHGERRKRSFRHFLGDGMATQWRCETQLTREQEFSPPTGPNRRARARNAATKLHQEPLHRFCSV